MINTGGKQQVKIEQLQQYIAELEAGPLFTQDFVDDLEQRIVELEKKNAQYAKMCVRNDEWLCARDQEIQRLGAALREQENSYAINKEYIKRIAELEQVLEIIADTSSSVDTRDIAEDALNRIRGSDE
jgi:DNA repair exonuclease SbcCD ATPase subunit